VGKTNSKENEADKQIADETGKKPKEVRVFTQTKGKPGNQKSLERPTGDGEVLECCHRGGGIPTLGDQDEGVSNCVVGGGGKKMGRKEKFGYFNGQARARLRKRSKRTAEGTNWRDRATRSQNPGEVK